MSRKPDSWFPSKPGNKCKAAIRQEVVDTEVAVRL